MCDPIVGPVLMVAAAGMAMVGQIQAGKQQKKLSNFQAQVDEVNAANAKDIATSEEERIRRQGYRVRAEQRAAIAGAGLDIASGSPLLLQVQAAEETELAALDARVSGNLQFDAGRRAAALRRAEGRLAYSSALFKGISGFGRSVAGGANAANDLGLFDSGGGGSSLDVWPGV